MLRNMIAAYPKVSYAEIRSLSSPGLPLDMLHRRMALSGYLKAVMLLSFRPGFGEQETGTVIPAESRPCVDCHAFEFMQRALHNLKKTAFNLDVRVTVPIPLCFSYTLCYSVIILVSTV
uniref:NELL2-interacting cell ontogeny regulator 1 n=1 Tax=Hucho hucho TaxID=62062 RepID=A0A4W5KP68_9TELE